MQTMDPTLKQAIASQTSFSLRLATHILSLPDFRNSNYAFSPLSIHSVLSLLIAGTTGPTCQQLLTFLGSNAASELSALHSHVSKFLLADGSAAGGPCLRYAFGVWVDDHDDTNLTNSFRETAGSVYKAAVNPVPFRTKVVKLPYRQRPDGREFPFCIFLPNALNGLPYLSMRLSSEPDFLSRHIPTEEIRVGYFKFPKFKVSMKTAFSDILKNQGLVLPFEQTEDFSEMVDAPDINMYHVKEIAHKCSVGVNEVGTEASGASTVSLRGGGALPKIDFVADHPFLFFIWEDKSGVVLFVGHLLNP